jgi:hypothetical protein
MHAGTFVLLTLSHPGCTLAYLTLAVQPGARNWPGENVVTAPGCLPGQFERPHQCHPSRRAAGVIQVADYEETKRLLRKRFPHRRVVCLEDT